MPENEWRRALALAALLLLALWLAKLAAPVPYLGSAAASLVALGQLYVPLWRCERLQLDGAALGLSWPGLAVVARQVVPLLALCLPAYAAALHLLLVHLPGWLQDGPLAPWVALWPQLHFHLPWPGDWRQSLALGLGGLHLVLLHGLGVALPEETFYRGYLQPRLQAHWRPRGRLLGVPFGGATLAATALFALGHFIGEWQPARLLPFFPGLLLAWLRQRSDSLAPCVVLHAACNLFAASWLACYRH